jgi:hypothetical protein
MASLSTGEGMRERLKCLINADDYKNKVRPPLLGGD